MTDLTTDIAAVCGAATAHAMYTRSRVSTSEQQMDRWEQEAKDIDAAVARLRTVLAAFALTEEEEAV